MPGSSDIYQERGQLSRPLVWSAVLPASFAGLVAAYAILLPSTRGAGWGGGGGGDAIGATLVSNVPLPANPEGQNVLANESSGLTQSLPKTEEKAPEAIPIPDKNTKIKPK